jgi:hypothetical protein
LKERIEEASVMGCWGFISYREGNFSQAQTFLSQSLSIKEDLHDEIGMIEPLNWLGLMYESQNALEVGEQFYQRQIGLSQYSRYYFECSAFVGMLRIKYFQNNYDDIPPLLAKAERLAQQYEFNDQLAAMRLIQGHIALENSVSPTSDDFNIALDLYKDALVYSLRYNRFLLDEILIGRTQGNLTPPLISHCLNDGEGHQMLIALLNWWSTGVNDVGIIRRDTISQIPEGILLMQSEHIARRLELGDQSPQVTVVERIEMFIN